MSERTSIVLSGTYALAFVYKALESRHAIRSQDFMAALKSTGEGLRGFVQGYYDRLESRGRNRYRSAVLQMLLLFDKAILVGTEPGWDFSRLESEGVVEVLDHRHESALLGDIGTDEATIEYAMFLKPMVLKSLLKDPNYSVHRRWMASKGIKPGTYYSYFYDSVFSPSTFLSERLEEKVADLAKSEAEQYGWDSDMVWAQWQAEVSIRVGRLMVLLELSNTKNAVLMQNEFGMDHLELDWDMGQGIGAKTLMDSYRILRLSYEGLIATLPRLSSIDDVLRLRDSRQADIRRLRSVLNDVEESLRAGKADALERAEREISRASLELSRGTEIEKVARWATYLALPVSIAEVWLDSLPIAGLITGSIGTVATLRTEASKRRAGWLQVIR